MNMIRFLGKIYKLPPNLNVNFLFTIYTFTICSVFDIILLQGPYGFLSFSPVLQDVKKQICDKGRTGLHINQTIELVQIQKTL